ncbi:MAG: hypothetical protein KA745_00175 [Gemmatimonadales bacterium]|nr:hypothetical protein [Gemmatimonadales bacterium]
MTNIKDPALGASTFVPGMKAIVEHGSGASAELKKVVLGDAATKNVGTAAGDVPVLGTGGLIPEAMIPGGGGGGVSSYGDLEDIPAAIDAIDGLVPVANTVARYTGPAAADLISVGAGGVSLLASADAAAARAFLGVDDAAPLSAEELRTVLEATRTAGGLPYTDLAAEVTQYADDAGANLPLPTNADVWTAPAGELVMPTMEVLRTSAAAVAMTVTPGTPDTTALSGAAGFLRTLALVGDTDLNAIALTNDGRERQIVASASGGDWWLTFTGADQVYGMPGDGVMVRNGESALISVRMVDASVQVTLISVTGDPHADVTVTLTGGNLAADARKGLQQRLVMAGNAALVAPAYLSGQWLDLRAVAEGAERIISAPGFDAARRYGVNTDGTVAVAAGSAALLRMRQSAAGPELWFVAGASSGRLVPFFVTPTDVATRRNQTGSALTPDNTANGDVAVLFDGRTGTAVPDAVAGFTQLAGMTASITNECSMRVSYKVLAAGETIPATVTGTRRVVLIYRDVDTSAPIVGTPQIGSGTSVNPVIPGQTLPNEGLVIGGWISGGTENMAFTAPLVERGLTGNGNKPLQVADSNGAVSTFAQQTYTMTSTPWIGFSLALRGEVG